MTQEDERGLGPDEPTFEGLEEEPKTALGFGGKTINRRLVIVDELYLLLKCEIVSDGRSRKEGDGDGLSFKAGARTTILAELSSGDAAQLAVDRG